MIIGKFGSETGLVGDLRWIEDCLISGYLGAVRQNTLCDVTGCADVGLREQSLALTLAFRNEWRGDELVTSVSVGQIRCRFPTQPAR